MSEQKSIRELLGADYEQADKAGLNWRSQARQVLDQSITPREKGALTTGMGVMAIACELRAFRIFLEKIVESGL